MGSSRRVFGSVVVLGTLLVAAACTHKIDKPPATNDTGNAPVGSSGGGGGGGGEGGADSGSVDDGGGGTDGSTSCSDLPDQGNYVDQNAIAGDPTNGTGGEIPADSIYNMIEANKYVGLSGVAGPTGTQIRGQLKFSNGVFERVYETALSGSNPSETRLRGVYTLTGTQISMHATCPFVVDDVFQYSVNTSSNTFVLTSLVSKESWTFQLQ